ncbi:phage protein Gp36 family protein [Hymenobacter glacieicola]|uniref:DUF1320 domain-containing protein n=1 Tax=Hymenobacter glacieicola TaxID=1562124 RepID=A0ABQ1WJ28_9BACT|nr:phage protein Gp36 family protein [Hymenobacter glacieicola]GGG33332.1 hypothetical protein GCM10011378_07230 [Hymenobacter glacieicola]
MSFITLADYKSQISLRDLEALTALEEEFPTEPTTVEVVLVDDEDDPEPATEPAPAPELSIRETAESNAMEEVASYLRGRFDMDAAYAMIGQARNKQLVSIVVDVALWNLSPKVAFANVSEVRQIRYEAAIKWLKLAEQGKSNPSLPRYALDPERPQAHRRFRYGSEPVRSQSF